MIHLTKQEIPFDKGPSYWVLPRLFLAGCYPGSRDKDTAKEKIEGILNCKIQYFIDLTVEEETNKKGQRLIQYQQCLRTIANKKNIKVTYRRIPIIVGDVPKRKTMSSILNIIDHVIAMKIPLYLHCRGGRGRTGTVVGCYIVRHGHAIGDEALKLLEKLRNMYCNKINPIDNIRQANFICSWKYGM